MILTDRCNRQHIAGFLSNQLNVDEQLEFLEHIETCVQCWEEIYNARKNEHPHFYKRTSRQVKISESELKRIDTLNQENEDDESQERTYQVA